MAVCNYIIFWWIGLVHINLICTFSYNLLTERLCLRVGLWWTFMLAFYIKIVGLHFCTIHIVRFNMKLPTHKTVKFSCEIGLENPLKCGHQRPRNNSVWSNLQALPKKPDHWHLICPLFKYSLLHFCGLSIKKWMMKIIYFWISYLFLD